MCDVCADFHDLLLSYEERAAKEPDDVSLCAIDVDTILHYVNQWVQRQCMCCYREAKNFDRFVRLTQSVVLCTLQQLRAIRQKRKPPDDEEASAEGAGRSAEDEEEDTEDREKAQRDAEESEKKKPDDAAEHSEKNREKVEGVESRRSSDAAKQHWSQLDREKLFHLLSKIFLLNFPLYIAMKHGGAINPLAPVKDEGGYCEPHDPEVPAPLIRAVSVFCHQGGFELMSACFDAADQLPVGLAHSMVAVICNLKLWLNYESVIQLFNPLRSRVMKYMCRLGDKELRTPAVRTMADFMWSAVKDPIDAAPPIFDRDGLDLAFKYFTSTTLTMRLAGVAQINTHITAFNELCNNVTVAEVEQVGHALAAWLTENNIIAHIFGPNLHAEVIKQSHIVLSFLAMEGRITSSDMDTMWQAAQLKHCARPVYDLLAPLVKHLAPTPVLHLYSLLGKLEPKDHTEQSLFLASALTKFIWTSGGPGYPGSLAVKNRDLSRAEVGVGESSSSDPSGIDASSPEEDEEEPSPAPSEGPSPRKQARGDSSDCEGNCKRGKSPEQMPVESNLADAEDFSVSPTSKLDRPSMDISTESPPTVSSPIDDPVIEDVDAKTDNETKEKRPLPQSTSDAEADTEISNSEEIFVHEKKKRKLLRKRKKPGKRLSELGEDEKVSLNEIVVTEDIADSHSVVAKDEMTSLEDSSLNMESTALSDSSMKKDEKLSHDTLDCVKEQQQRSQAIEPNDQQVPSALQLRGASKSSGSEKYMSLHVGVDGHVERGPDSAESSHDEDDSDNAVAAGVVVGTSGVNRPNVTMADLVGLVDANGRPFLPTGLDEMLSDEEGSYSSRISNKSEKNMADFDGEESGCEEELAQLAARHLTAIQMQAYHPHSHHHHHHQHHHQPQHPQHHHQNQQPHHHHHHHHHHHNHHHSQPGMRRVKRSCFRPRLSDRTRARRRARLRQQTTTSRLGSQFSLDAVCKTGAANSRFASQFNLETVCKPGSTLLWDLLQDDKIGQLGEGLALEAEKALCNLLCFNVDRLIPMKFIEGCLENLANNQSVVISLRLLPKLLASFQQFGAMDAHTITTWADRERGMMKHFFNNLKTYACANANATAGSSSSCSSTSSGGSGGNNNFNGGNLYPHQTEIQVRLQFLSSIFSPLGSPDCFRLSLEQVDILWQCLSQDPTCADELFSWLLSQAKSTEQHALGMDTLKHLCLRKLPSLPPETISMTGLSLFQQLCNLARLAAAHLDRPLRDVDSVGMDFLWRIALRAKSTDVSMAAIQYLNGYYMSRQLTLEAEFVSQCMTHLAAASADLENNEEASLRCIQRALLLLRTHLEAFRKRYAYHLRRWALEGRGAGSHVAMNTAEKGQNLRIFVQPAGIPDKTSISLLSTDYVADLRAEVAKWWDDTQNGGRASAAAAAAANSTAASSDSSAASSSGSGPLANTSSVLGTLLTDRDGPIRMITQGQELTFDFDEKTLQEMGFKDGQLVYISLGAGARGSSGCGSQTGSRGSGKRDIDSASLLPPPPKESLPTLLLLRPQYFEQLFTLMRTLSAMKTTLKVGQKIANTKAQVLSRRVWDTLTLLPTSPTLLRGFQKLGETSLPELLDPASPQKLMYSLYIVESLSRKSPSTSSTSSSPSSHNSSGSSSTSAMTITPVHEGSGDSGAGGSSSSTNIAEETTEAESKEFPQDEPVPWSTLFVQHGGLRHLFDIFMSGCLERGDGSEWQQDCLASLLKQLCHLGVVKEEKKSRKHKPEKLIVPRLSEAMLSMMVVDSVMPRLTSILNEASMPRDPNHYKTGLFGRSQVIHYAMALLVCWVHSDPNVRQYLFLPGSPEPFGRTWLRRLVLEDPEPAVRREVCTALYRLCLGTTGTEDEEESDSERPDATSLIVPMLNTLLEYLVVAEAMQPSHRRRPDLPLHLHSALDDGKEPYGPACRDYFWLVCRLVDALPDDAIKDGTEAEAESGANEGSIDLEALASRVIDSVLSREHLETRHNTVEDDALVGLLNLTCNIMTHNPPCKQAKIGQNLLHCVFDFLFDLPNPRMKHVPKCKSQVSRSAAFDLLVELVKSAPENYRLLHEKLMVQHRPGPHSPYPWDYWPHEDGRSDCGYVGLTNLGATCYMASCMQHLYMMPQARVAILGADCNRANKHQLTLRELQRMFAYLLESERKAYNPRSFCRVYTMNHEPLNTGEQKDMAEFFIDLVSKLEEMTSDLKHLVKTLFCGVISNNVVSLDCEHVSRTLEEFYTVRCQVADMRNLYESLDEVTVKDTLEGDNMYTCSQCGKKARAEKRACFKKLPHILCFNTMRYTFNMGTMLKEKVNTHFSFPLRLDMSGYVEKKLMPQHCREERDREDGSGDAGAERSEIETELDDAAMEINSSSEEKPKSDSEAQMEHYQYDLIGVTVHTGTADGGHYYSFIRDRTSANKDKWFLFNDAEVKPFDPSQIAAECFGGEMTSKTYDSVTDKFMDFSFEKTNSAYMLFYEWCSDPNVETAKEEEATVSSPVSCVPSSYGLEELNRTYDKCPPQQSTPQQQTQQLIQPPHSPQLVLNKELEDWIWQDNTHFLQDKNIFEHTYFSFMWQICGYIPQTLLSMQPDVTELSAELSTSFFMETFIHAKEKPTMVQWVELLTKQFNGSAGACARFLERMAGDSWWPIQILVKCPNQMVRQMFQRLCIHVIQRLRSSQAPLYLLCETENDSGSSQYNGVGTQSCVTRFVRMLLSLMEHAKQHLKHLTEYFGFLYEFSKMGEEETLFLIRVQAVSTMVNFYLGHKTHETSDAISEEEEEEEEEVVLAVASEKLRPASLDKMITLIATLVERSRGADHRLTLSPADLNAVAGGKGFPFLYQQTRDVINLNQTRNLIQSLCRWNDRLAIHIVTMIFQAITKHTDVCQPFFKLLTLLTEGSAPSGLPCMTQLILSRVWEAARVAPHGALEWLALAVTRSKLAHAWVLQGLDTWLQHFLIEHSNQRVRSAAAFLLVSLVPSTHFRQGYRGAYRLGLGCNSSRELQLSSEATIILHQIYTALLRLLQPARHYIDIQTHGTMKLTAYFALLTYCAVSKTEKLMFGQYLNDLWTLFHPKLSEPSIPVHHNKQAVLLFWYHVCCECPENVAMILHNPHITKNIAFNYILADHEDQDVVLFNRVMLPAYYGLLRLCCQQSRVFTRQLAAHQNIQWAFKNITPHPTQYSTAVDELFKLMQLLVTRHPDQTEQEEAEIASFRRGTLSSYLQGLDGRSCWATLISAFRCLIESDDDRLYVVYNGGLSMALEAFHMLHIMYHEATACHVAGDLAELIAIIVELVRCVRTARDGPDARNILGNCKEWPDVLRKLATLLNTYNPPDMRNLAIDLLKELVMLVPAEAILILAPLLSHCHAALQESHAAVPPGPYLPRRSTAAGKMGSRPARPMVQMAVPHSQLESAKGHDPEYDSALLEFYLPYHELIDVMCRLAINNDCMTDTLVNLSAMLGFEGVPLHLALFPRLWLDVHAATHIDRKHIAALLCSSYTVDYVDAVLLDERSSLGVPAIHAFLKTFFPKLANHVLTEQTCSLIDNLVTSMSAMVEAVDLKISAHRLTGDLRALALVYSSGTRLEAPPSLLPALETLLARTRAARMKETSQQEVEAPSKKRKFTPSEEATEETARRKSHSPTNENRGERDSNSEMDVEDKDKTEKEEEEVVKSSEAVEERLAHDDKSSTTKIERSSDGTSISSSLVSASGTGSTCANQLLCSLTNVSWLEMLEKTIINLQVIVTLQTKNN